MKSGNPEKRIKQYDYVQSVTQTRLEGGKHRDERIKCQSSNVFLRDRR